MESFQTPQRALVPPNIFMNTISTSLRNQLRFFSVSSTGFSETLKVINDKSCRKKVLNVKLSNAEVKEKWLDSLCCPRSEKVVVSDTERSTSNGVDLDWVIGIDPDVSGALALLKRGESGYSAEVFDNPHVQVLVGKRVRRRLDAKAIVQMLQSFGAPYGTTAYIEQSSPFPQDGKLGWWSGGFGYGMWIGVLVASGYSVVPVPSLLWKNHFQLAGSRLSKDDSRKAASTLFPSLSSLLKRKKDHGRAEALLIAAYGKGLEIKQDEMKSEEVIEIKSEKAMKSEESIEIKAEKALKLEEALEITSEESLKSEESIKIEVEKALKSEESIKIKVEEALKSEEPVDIKDEDALKLEEVIEIKFEEALTVKSELCTALA